MLDPFYGLSTQELLTARLDAFEDDLIIVFEHPKRTYGRHYYNREETLRLPKTPPWFADLQQRFLQLWQNRHAATKKTFPCRRLLLLKHQHYTRPICDMTLAKRIYSTTVAATGTCIPASLLRQTCGHLYSQNGDGSLLSKLGWSAQFAFHYTWLPRRIPPQRPAPKHLKMTKIRFRKTKENLLLGN